MPVCRYIPALRWWTRSDVAARIQPRSAARDQVPGRPQQVCPQQVTGVERRHDLRVRGGSAQRMPSDQSACPNSCDCTQVSSSTTSTAEESGGPTTRWVASRRASTCDASRFTGQTLRRTADHRPEIVRRRRPRPASAGTCSPVRMSFTSLSAARRTRRTGCRAGRRSGSACRTGRPSGATSVAIPRARSCSATATASSRSPRSPPRPAPRSAPAGRRPAARGRAAAPAAGSRRWTAPRPGSWSGRRWPARRSGRPRTIAPQDSKPTSSVS